MHAYVKYKINLKTAMEAKINKCAIQIGRHWDKDRFIVVCIVCILSICYVNSSYIVYVLTSCSLYHCIYRKINWVITNNTTVIIFIYYICTIHIRNSVSSLVTCTSEARVLISVILTVLLHSHALACFGWHVKTSTHRHIMSHYDLETFKYHLILVMKLLTDTKASIPRLIQ